jgi:hypothetical protein
MILIKYFYKNSNGFRQLESEAKLKDSLDVILQKAKLYNQDTSNDIYIREVRDLDVSPPHTYILNYEPVNTFKKVKVKAKNQSLGGSIFTSVYAIPYGDI